MSLLSQVAGALLAGALIFALGRQAGAQSKRAVGAVALIPVTVAIVLALPSLRDATANLLDLHRINASLTAEDAQLQGGSSAGVDVAFISWAKGHLAAGDTFYLETEDPNATAITQWALFQLAPHLEVAESSKADWLIFYNSSRTLDRLDSSRALDIYSSGFAIADNTHAR